MNLSILPAESKAVLLENLKKRMQGAPVEPCEVCFAGKAGEKLWVEVKGRKISYAGQPANLVLFHDITRRRENQRRLKEYAEMMEVLVEEKVKEIRESGACLRSLFENSLDGVMLTKPDGAILAANPQACRMLGMSEDEVKKAGREGVVVKDEKLAAALKELERTSRVIAELTFRRKDGTTFAAEVASSVFTDANGEIKTSLIIRDLSERKKLEEALRTSEEKLKIIFENAPDAVYLSDLQGRFIDGNKQAEILTGYGREELIGKTFLETGLLQKNQITRAMKALARSVLGKKTGPDELELLRKDGKHVTAEIVTIPIKRAGKVEVIGIARDITERKKMELMLKRSEEKYRKQFEEALDAIVVADAETGIIIGCNRAAVELVGREKSELIGKHQRILHPPEEIIGDFSRTFKQHLKEKEGQIIEAQVITKKGEIKDVAIKASIFELENKRVLQGIFRDITEQKKTAEALQESEENFRAISNSIKDALIVVDDQSEIVFWNPAAQEIFGYTKEETMGRKVEDLLMPTLNPQQRKMLESGLRAFAETGKGALIGKTVELTALRKNGTEFPLNLSVTSMRLRNKWHAVALARDITEQKQLWKKLEEYSAGLELTVEARTRELKEAHARLLRAERLATIGELAGMVGHDLRNPLTSIKNAAYFLKKKGTAIREADAEAMLEVIEKSIDHSDKIISDLLDYAREMRLELQMHPTRKLITETLTWIKVPEKIKIINNVPDELSLRIDKNKIERVFLNLIKNAIEAMPNGGTITINCKQRDGNVEISIADTGNGIPEEILPKLFSPLFTTKAQGMGFGLAICKRIVEAHGGTITVETAKGKGATFTVTLPMEPKLEIGGEKVWINIPESSLSTMTKA